MGKMLIVNSIKHFICNWEINQGIISMQSWAEEMANSEDEFISRERYGIKRVETVADNSHKQVDAAGGITGTFKKLNCD